MIQHALHFSPRASHEFCARDTFNFIRGYSVLDWALSNKNEKLTNLLIANGVSLVTLFMQAVVDFLTMGVAAAADIVLLLRLI